MSFTDTDLLRSSDLACNKPGAKPVDPFVNPDPHKMLLTIEPEQVCVRVQGELTVVVTDGSGLHTDSEVIVEVL